MSKFKDGEAVIYKKGDIFQLGIIKQVMPIETTKRHYSKQDGLFGEPTGEEYTETSYKYFVNYHRGETASLTNECDLLKIENAYAFEIRRIQAK